MIEKETPNTKPTETKPKVRRSENFREQPKLYKITRSSHINIKDTQLQQPQTETNAGPSSTKGRPTVLLKDTPETLQNLPQTMFEQSTGSLGIVPQEKKLNTVASVVLEADKKLIATLKKKSGLHQPSTMGFLKGLVSYWRKDMSDISNDDLIELASFILKKPPEKRNSKDISILSKCLASVEYFQKHDTKTSENIFKRLQHVFMPQGSTVFKIGSVGTTFWIILKGSVGIWTYVHSYFREKGTEVDMAEVRVLSAGSSFGELALIENNARSASAICKEDCYFAILEKEDYKKILLQSESRRVAEQMEFFSFLPIFKEWPSKTLRNVTYIVPVSKFQRGFKVYKEGDTPEKMYIVKKGEFKILKHIEIKTNQDPVWQTQIEKMKRTNITKKSIEMAIIGEKEIFGEEELYNGTSREYTVICNSIEGELYEIDKKIFFDRLLKFPSSAKWLANHIQLKLKYYENRLKSLSDATSKHKALLMFERKDFEVDRLTVHISKQDSNTYNPFLNEEASIPSRLTHTQSQFKVPGSGINSGEKVPTEYDDGTSLLRLTTEGFEGRRKSIKSLQAFTPNIALSRVASSLYPSSQGNPESSSRRMSIKLVRREESSKDRSSRRSINVLTGSSARNTPRDDGSFENKNNGQEKNAMKMSWFSGAVNTAINNKGKNSIFSPDNVNSYRKKSLDEPVIIGLVSPAGNGRKSARLIMPKHKRHLTEGEIIAPKARFDPESMKTEYVEAESVTSCLLKNPLLESSPGKIISEKLKKNMKRHSDAFNLKVSSPERFLSQEDQEPEKPKTGIVFNNAIMGFRTDYFNGLGTSQTEEFKNIHMMLKKAKEGHKSHNAFERASLKLQEQKIEKLIKKNGRSSSQSNFDEMEGPKIEGKTVQRSEDVEKGRRTAIPSSVRMGKGLHLKTEGNLEGINDVVHKINTERWGGKSSIAWRRHVI